ncbi:MAG: toll/interleukin-1 receptor domain-containing protein [Chloroflexi bacterium]|nr:toll/interleukin-1 receptor domain-containing protein [Chloroflexota bacterium]MDA1003530.1 toll/interleukin-1 receptor domain-containing protein [Chloroflexota bacterium]
MPDVFISYSRRDRDFVVELREALEGRDYATWVDETDIAPSVNWRAEIHNGIESTDALLVVVSPDYAASAVCVEEIERASELGKRIVPIACRDTDPALLHPAVAERNWIFWRNDGERAAAVEKVDEALRVDPDWTKEHTRLLSRALQWQRGGHDKSPLLRGSELEAAEAALVVSRSPGQPQVTDLQREFVRASRTDASRRSRRIVGISLGVAAVSLTLAVFAVLQTVEANHQRDTARERQRVAQSRSLSAQALQIVDSEPDTAALLAVIALRLAPTVEGRDALLIALDQEPTALRSLNIVTEAGTAVTSIPDPTGRFEVSEEGSLLRDTATGETQTLIERVPGGSEVALRDASFSPDGTRLVFHNLPEARFEVFDLSDGLPGAVLPSPVVDGHTWDAAYRNDGRLVALWSSSDQAEDLFLTVFDDAARPIFNAPFTDRLPEGVDLQDSFLVMSPDEDMGAIVTVDGEAQLFSPAAAQLLGPLLPVDCTPDCGDVDVVAAANALGKLERDVLSTTDHASVRRIWTLELGRWIAAACELAGRDLTLGERARFLTDLSEPMVACPR